MGFVNQTIQDGVHAGRQYETHHRQQAQPPGKAAVSEAGEAGNPSHAQAGAGNRSACPMSDWHTETGASR